MKAELGGEDSCHEVSCWFVIQTLACNEVNKSITQGPVVHAGLHLSVRVPRNAALSLDCKGVGLPGS